MTVPNGKLIGILSLGFIVCAWSSAHALNMKQAFNEGKFQGQIRTYNNTLNFQHGPDKYGTAFGGRLAFETKADHLYGFSGGVGYYTANDLSTNHDDVSARAPFTPTVDVDILGEAFLRYTGYDTVATAGRQLIDTPFANPADAFVVPVTFTGYSIINKSVPGLTINAHHILSVKTRESQKFVDVGHFVAGRAGGVAQNTDGNSILGLTYDWHKLKVQAWYYRFADMFNQEWFQADYDVDLGGDYTPYVSAQYGMEKGLGSELLGTVDSKMAGVKLGMKAFGANFSLAMNNVSDNRYLMPYSYFTDITYTNSMISGMGNVAAGTGYKAMLTYDFTSQLWGKLSYSKFEFKGDKDTSEADADVRYKFAGDFENLSLWLRAGYRDGANVPAGLADLIEYRSQLQYTF